MELQLTEAVPNLLEIGANQEETKKLLTEHEQLLVKLKVCILRQPVKLSYDCECN